MIKTTKADITNAVSNVLNVKLKYLKDSGWRQVNLNRWTDRSMNEPDITQGWAVAIRHKGSPPHVIFRATVDQAVDMQDVLDTNYTSDQVIRYE